MKNVLLVGDIGIGAHGNFHIGDEAMWLANANWYLDNGWQVTASSRNPNDQHRNVTFVPDTYIPDHATLREYTNPEHPEFLRFQRVIAEADLIHISGGGNMNSLWPGHFFYRSFLVHIARTLGKKIIATSQTVGPLTEDQIDLLASYKDCFLYFGVRDAHTSLALLKKADFSDAILHVDADDAIEISSMPDEQKQKNALFIGLHETEINHARVIKYASHCSLCTTPHVIQSDSFESSAWGIPLCQQLPSARKNKEELVSWSKRSIQHMQGGIVSRYHAGVFSLMQGIPIIACAEDAYYTTKFQGLFEYFEIPSEGCILSETDNPSIEYILATLEKQKACLNLSAIATKLQRDKQRIYETIVDYGETIESHP